jgi:hypothetical protein
MFRCCLPVFLLFALWFNIRPGDGAQAEKKPEAEAIGAPKIPVPWIIDTPDLIIGGPLPRPDSREVWQYYGVNRFGRFVPRVIMTPGGGGYYYRNGEPYPWVPSRAGQVMPYAVD